MFVFCAVFRRELKQVISLPFNIYKGLLKEKLLKGYTRKRRIAVKKLDSDSKQGLRQWQTEVGFLARVSHPNIVKLLGYCQENANKELLIVYQFMEKGSLNYHLFGKRSDRLLPWETRLKIITGMARALSYLHTIEGKKALNLFSKSDASFFLGTIASFNIWFCMATTNFLAQLSLSSGVFAAMRGNKVTEDREFPVSPDEEEP
ncbi:hypothetical protein POPTR_018G134501v4 [Populus trichocarpa]|uniref:Uncharacterized protein n=1 Tax=Populus trichocarpa TaxID=3694 RepID=A0ACC0RN33_POPTR|nr:hypothetical protein POPTR_018G134501v4 [Populus trichocarpa]